MSCIRLDEGTVPAIRVVMNRDERLSRPPALAPRVFHIDGIRVAMPVDAEGGGTWIASTEAGLVLMLLNGDGVAPARRQTRGAIIPVVAGARTLGELEDAVWRVDARRHAPFHLVVSDGARLVEANGDGTTLRVKSRALAPRELFTSSSPLPATAREKRTRLFHQLVPTPGVSEQDRFHDHTFASAPEFGVVMERADARTVSRTVVTLEDGRVWLRYRALPAGEAVDVHLPLRAIVAPPSRELPRRDGVQ